MWRRPEVHNVLRRKIWWTLETWFLRYAFGQTDRHAHRNILCSHTRGGGRSSLTIQWTVKPGWFSSVGLTNTVAGKIYTVQLSLSRRTSAGTIITYTETMIVFIPNSCCCWSPQRWTRHPAGIAACYSRSDYNQEVTCWCGGSLTGGKQG